MCRRELKGLLAIQDPLKMIIKMTVCVHICALRHQLACNTQNILLLDVNNYTLTIDTTGTSSRS